MNTMATVSCRYDDTVTFHHNICENMHGLPLSDAMSCSVSAIHCPSIEMNDNINGINNAA